MLQFDNFVFQGDEERRLNVPVSPFMDRSEPKVAELQRTFITNLITPIVHSMHKSGILAGEISEDHGECIELHLIILFTEKVAKRYKTVFYRLCF